MPGFTQTQTLAYEQHTETIAALGRALDMLGHKQVTGAIEELMALRNRLQDAQRPRVVDYDPRLVDQRLSYVEALP